MRWDANEWCSGDPIPHTSEPNNSCATTTSHTFANVASPASYAVTVQANSAEGAGEAMTVTLSTGSYVKNDGTVVDPILDTSGNVLNGPKSPGQSLNM